MSFLGNFDHTTGKTWGGTQLNPGLLKATSVLGGFFGLDHLLLRSPRTALFKFIFNLISFGFWYWYDILQVFFDEASVKEFGYTIPILGPVGLGAGILADPSKSPAPEGTPSPWLFLAYMLLVFVPLGFSSFLAGDFRGGAAKFLLTWSVWFTILGLVWTIYSGIYAVLNTESLLTKGTDRLFPTTLFMDPYGPAPNLIPPKLAEEEKKLQSSWFSWIPGFSLVENLLQPVEKAALKTVVAVGEPVLNVAESVKNSTIAETSKSPAVAQVGGAILAASGFDSSKAVFFGTVALILVGAIGITGSRMFLRKKDTSLNQTEKNDVPPEGFRNDVPPGPRVL